MHLDHFLSKKNIEGAGSSLLNVLSDVVAAYVSNNRVNVSEIPELIRQVYLTLVCLEDCRTTAMGSGLDPAVPVADSVTDDYIICLEDGKPLKMLKRHLRAVYNLTPEQYRMRWGLPEDYPMVAPNYAKKRSSLAKMNGLGQSPTSEQRSVSCL
ncbi:MucR family transcriptional regulator [bacterium NHP-B]|jgi:predicted transcriptional regulator|nr:MucR family transcriptional regulator [bacterium NHP-B]